MRVKLQLSITINEETTVMFENSKSTDFDGVNLLLEQLYFRALEHVSEKKMEEIEEED